MGAPPRPYLARSPNGGPPKAAFVDQVCETMRPLLKWGGYALAAVVGLLLAVVGAIYGASEAIIRWPVDAPAVRMVASHDPGAVARGRRVAIINGCHDCHGAALEGTLFHDEMPIVRAYGPNLSRALLVQSDAAIDRAIRHGVAADGRRLWIMPSSAYSHLTDREAADLVAYLRTFRPIGTTQPRLQVGPLGRVAVIMGQFRSEPAILKAEDTTSLEEVRPEHARGRELARACIECHGPTLAGREMLKSPNLTMVASYDAQDFETLLRTGIAAGGRKLGLMTQVSPKRFNVLTSDEIAALHGYLKARAQRRIATADGAAVAVQHP